MGSCTLVNYQEAVVLMQLGLHFSYVSIDAMTGAYRHTMKHVKGSRTPEKRHSVTCSKWNLTGNIVVYVVIVYHVHS